MWKVFWCCGRFTKTRADRNRLKEKLNHVSGTRGKGMGGGKRKKEKKKKKPHSFWTYGSALLIKMISESTVV